MDENLDAPQWAVTLASYRDHLRYCTLVFNFDDRKEYYAFLSAKINPRQINLLPMISIPPIVPNDDESCGLVQDFNNYSRYRFHIPCETWEVDTDFMDIQLRQIQVWKSRGGKEKLCKIV